MILDPFGEILAECRALGDDLVVAALDPEKVKVASGQGYIRCAAPGVVRDDDSAESGYRAGRTARSLVEKDTEEENIMTEKSNRRYFMLGSLAAAGFASRRALGQNAGDEIRTGMIGTGNRADRTCWKWF